MTITYSQRGFGRVDFKDGHGKKCSLQESSLAFESYIWLGIDDVEVIDYAGTPRVLNIKPLGGNVKALGRMHLNREQVAVLLPHLQRFAQTGYLGPSSNEVTDAQRFEAYALSQGITCFEKNADGTYQNSVARLMRNTWDAAHTDFKEQLEGK